MDELPLFMTKILSIFLPQEITNNQVTITKQIPITNNQSPNSKFGYLNLVIGDCLVIVSWCLVISHIYSFIVP